MTPKAHREHRGASALIPSVAWLRAYQKSWLRPDLVAGVTAAAVVVPKAMAYATIDGLPVQVGLYTVFVPMIVYALLGTSRPLSVSTTTTIAILAASELGRVAPNGDPADLLVAAATLSVLVGVILIAAFALRLGFVANFISEPVLVGFKSGIGLVIVVDQIPKLLGIHFDKGGFAHNVLGIVTHVAATNLAALGLAVVVLGLIYGLHRFAPKAPAPLIAIAVGIAGSTLLGPQAGVETIGTVARELPHFIWPRFDLFVEMWPAAAGIALMSFTETIAAARVFGGPGEPRPVPNQELFAVGMANVAGGLLGAMPAGGGTSQTLVVRSVGGRTQMASVITAATSVATMLVLAPMLSLLPMTALAAIVIVYSVGLISPSEFMSISKIRNMELTWALAAFC